jgi:subtilisin family serine protease
MTPECTARIVLGKAWCPRDVHLQQCPCLKHPLHATGPVSVDVAAPGVSVLGLGIGGSYVYMTGTSMATPHVTGVAAIILGK